MNWSKFVVASAAVWVFGCGSDSDDGNNANNPSENNPVAGVTQVKSYGFVFDFVTSRVVAIDDGLVVAGNVGPTIRVIRLNSALEPVWAQDITGTSYLSDLDVDSEGRIVMVAQAGADPGFIIRLNSDGSLDRSVSAAGGYFQDMAMLDDGGFMLNDGVRLDTNLEVVSRGTASGDRVVKTSDGYAFLSARDLALMGRSSGVLVRRSDEDANLVWQSFSSPSPANYYAVGLREMPDGSIMAAVSGDTNPGHTLVVAIFEADGAHRTTVQPAFSTLDQNGYEVPLQFGSGIAFLADGANTYASFVANSGGLGSDFRTQITARLGADGNVTGALFNGGGLAKLGSSLVVAHMNNLISTNTFDSECVASPTVGGGVIESQTEFKGIDEINGNPRNYEIVEHTVTIAPSPEVILSTLCPSETHM